MKVAIVLGSNIHWAPYYYRYEPIINDLGFEFDLIMWNREAIAEESTANIISFDVTDVSNNKDPKKFIKFIRFSYFVYKALKKKKYDKVIFLGTHGCAPCFCAPFLNKHYKNKIWLDIRDDQYEWFPPFYWGEKLVIKSSFATTISSYGYAKFLPEHKYFYMHNIDDNVVRLAEKFVRKPDPSGKIRISFIGNVRYFEQNVKILNNFANDNRFIIQYFGKGIEELQDYCTTHKIYNVLFEGLFPQDRTIEFYEKTDIINNAYGNETLNLQLALSNKLYYALILKLPILVSSGTLMEKLTREHGFGIAFQDDPEFPNVLYAWYHENQNNQKNNYNNLWTLIKKEDNECIEKLNDFFNE